MDGTQFLWLLGFQAKTLFGECNCSQDARKNLVYNNCDTSYWYSLCILRRPQNFEKSPPYFCLQYIQTKLRWKFRKILWPSQNIWTLLITICRRYKTENPSCSGNFLTYLDVHSQIPQSIPWFRIYYVFGKFEQLVTRNQCIACVTYPKVFCRLTCKKISTYFDLKTTGHACKITLSNNKTIFLSRKKFSFCLLLVVLVFKHWILVKNKNNQGSVPN